VCSHSQSSELKINIVDVKWLLIHTHCGPKTPKYNTELICNITIIYLLTSPAYCCYTTLGNVGYSDRKVWRGNVTCGCTKTDALSLSGCTSLICINPGIKIDGCYYRDIVMMQQMLLSIRPIAGDACVFQEDNAPAHRALQTVELLQCETPKFIAPYL